MHWQYRKICNQVGLDAEKRKKIQRILDHEKQQRRRLKKNAEKYGISIISMDALCNVGSDALIRLENQKNTYDEAVKNMALQYLYIFLARLSVDDRYILMSLGILSDREIAQKLGISKSTVQYRRQKLIELLKKWYQKETILL